MTSHNLHCYIFLIKKLALTEPEKSDDIPCSSNIINNINIFDVKNIKVVLEK